MYIKNIFFYFFSFFLFNFFYTKSEVYLPFLGTCSVIINNSINKIEFKKLLNANNINLLKNKLLKIKDKKYFLTLSLLIMLEIYLINHYIKLKKKQSKNLNNIKKIKNLKEKLEEEMKNLKEKQQNLELYTHEINNSLQESINKNNTELEELFKQKKAILNINNDKSKNNSNVQQNNFIYLTKDELNEFLKKLKL